MSSAAPAAPANRPPARRWRRALDNGWTAPFTTPVPVAIRRRLAVEQAERLNAGLPLLCLVIAANALAMAMAVLGDLPWWQQAVPPALIITTCLIAVARLRARRHTRRNPVRQLRTAARIATALGLVAGLWCVNAFVETERYYCMVAPVFLGIGSLVAATCLLAAPRAALAGMIAAVTPIAARMAAFDNLGVRAMAVMLVLLTAMQGAVVLGKFRETVGLLVSRHELTRVAASDALTTLANRRAFMPALEGALARGRPVLLALLDLDGFKQVNDRHGHQAGDALLVEVAGRIRTLAPRALSLARLGGDEFALLFDIASGEDGARAALESLYAAISLPFAWQGGVLMVGASIGSARSPADGSGAAELLLQADTRLYADKARRQRSALGLLATPARRG
ncbi:MAG: diguanylate cyclase [Proteobacteria bacterium]|nr:diguanylate cyclase [Pseudomonadota bacterium]